MINKLDTQDKDLRPSWDAYFLGIADAVAQRADCTRSLVGAVLVDQDHRIISTGYNGAPSGVPGCLTANACPRGRLSYDDLPPGSEYGNCIAFHAEHNAILYADPALRAGTTLYVTRRPCTGCHQLLLAEGISRVVWWTPERQLAEERQYH